MSQDLEELGRFAEPSLLILVSLSNGPKHGYAMMAEAEEIGGMRLGPGTLYAALARLEARGLIEALPSDDRRRPYRLSALGERVLRARLDRLGGLVRIGQGRLEGAARG